MTFKFLLSGLIGRIGRYAREQTLRDPEIISVAALSRRPLSHLTQHAKVKVLVWEDFSVYSDDIVAEVADSDGCIW